MCASWLEFVVSSFSPRVGLVRHLTQVSNAILLIIIHLSLVVGLSNERVTRETHLLYSSVGLLGCSAVLSSDLKIAEHNLTFRWARLLDVWPRDASELQAQLTRLREPPSKTLVYLAALEAATRLRAV